MGAYHLEQLAWLCRAYPFQEKVVFAPSRQVGYNLTTALAASGQGWANLRMTTPEIWAQCQVGPQLEADGWKPSSQDLELFYLEDILTRMQEEAAGHYFSELPLSAGLIRTFLQTVQSLNLAGVELESLEPAGVEPGKARFLARLCREYRECLKVARLYDPARLFQEAVRRRQPERNSQTIFAILDETPLTGSALRYLKKLTEGRLHRLGRTDYGMAPPVHSAAARFAELPVVEAGGQVGAGGRLLRQGLSPSDRAQVQVKKALGKEAEVRGVFRDLFLRGIPLDAVEIAYTSEVPYVSLLHDTAASFQLPLALAAGIPVTLTCPGQALLGFYRWIGSRMEAKELIGLCRAELLTFSAVLMPGESLEPYRLAMLLEQGGVGRGGEDYRIGFERLRRRFELQRTERAEQGRISADLRAEQVWLREARRVLDGLLALAPRNQCTLSQVADASIGFLQTFAPLRSDSDAHARESLIDRLRQMGEAVNVKGPSERLVQRLADLIAGHRIEVSVARPGRVYAVPIERAGYTDRRHLYVLGMDEGAFPGGATEDPVLLDDERLSLSAQLALQRSRPGERVWNLVRALGMASGEVTLLAACWSLTDSREIYPCALFHQAAVQVQCDKPVSTFPIVPQPEDALDDGEAMLGGRKAAGFREAVEAAFPWLVRGQQAVQGRRQPGLSRFHGWLGRGTPAIADGRTVLSASRLETLAACPYRYFLRYVLMVDPPEIHEEDSTRWLTPLEFGALLHQLFYCFMRTLQDRREFPDPQRHHDLIEEMLQEQIDHYRERIPVAHEAAYRADCDRLRQASRIFLAAEAERRGIEPVGFEVSFGFGQVGSLSCAEAVRLRLSDQVQLALRGRIDRVDRVANGYEIWDYKTGSVWGYDEQNLLGGGLRLQWALYAYALEETLQQGRIVKSGYFFPGERGDGRRMGDVPPDRGKMAELLAPLLELVSRGCFFHVHKGGSPCMYCDYNRICSAENSVKSSKDLEGIAHERRELVACLKRWLDG